MTQYIRYKVVAENSSVSKQFKLLPFWEETVLVSIYLSLYEAVTSLRPLLIEREMREVELEWLGHELKEKYNIEPSKEQSTKIYDAWFAGSVLPKGLIEAGINGRTLVDTLQNIRTLHGVTSGYIAQDPIKEAGYVNSNVFDDIATELGVTSTDILKELARQGYIVRYKSQRHGYLILDRMPKAGQKLRLSENFKSAEQKLRLRLINLVPNNAKISVKLRKLMRQTTGDLFRPFKKDVTAITEMLKVLIEYTVAKHQLEYCKKEIAEIPQRVKTKTNNDLEQFACSPFLAALKKEIAEIGKNPSTGNAEDAFEQIMLGISLSQQETLNMRQHRVGTLPKVMVPTSRLRPDLEQEQIIIKQSYHPTHWGDKDLEHNVSVEGETKFDLMYQASRAVDAAIAGEIKEQVTKMPEVVRILEPAYIHMRKSSDNGSKLKKETIISFEDRVIKAIDLIKRSPLVDKNSAKLELDEALAHLRIGTIDNAYKCIGRAIGFLRIRISDAAHIRENLDAGELSPTIFADIVKKHGLEAGSIYSDLQSQEYISEENRLLCYPRQKGFSVFFSKNFFVEHRNSVNMKELRRDVSVRMREMQQGRRAVLRSLTHKRNVDMLELCINIRHAVAEYANNPIGPVPRIKNSPYITKEWDSASLLLLKYEEGGVGKTIGSILNETPHLQEPEFGLSFFSALKIDHFLKEMHKEKQTLIPVLNEQFRIRQDIATKQAFITSKETKLKEKGSSYLQRTVQTMRAEISNLADDIAALLEQNKIVAERAEARTGRIANYKKKIDNYLTYITRKAVAAENLLGLMTEFRSLYEFRLLTNSVPAIKQFPKINQRLYDSAFQRTWNKYAKKKNLAENNREYYSQYALFYMTAFISTTMSESDRKFAPDASFNPVFVAAQELLAVTDSANLPGLAEMGLVSEKTADYIKNTGIKEYKDYSFGLVSDDMFDEIISESLHPFCQVAEGKEVPLLTSKVIRGALVYQSNGKYVTKEHRLLEMPSYHVFKKVLLKRLQTKAKDKTLELPDGLARQLYEKLKTVTNQAEDIARVVAGGYKLGEEDTADLLRMAQARD